MNNDRLNESLKALFREIERVQAAKRAAPRQGGVVMTAQRWTVLWWGGVGACFVLFALFLTVEISGGTQMEREAAAKTAESTARMNAEDMAQMNRSIEWNAKARAREAENRAREAAEEERRHYAEFEECKRHPLCSCVNLLGAADLASWKGSGMSLFEKIDWCKAHTDWFQHQGPRP
jgi:hypothetical protein